MTADFEDPSPVKTDFDGSQYELLLEHLLSFMNH